MKARTLILFAATAAVVYFVWKMTRGKSSSAGATSSGSGLWSGIIERPYPPDLKPPTIGDANPPVVTDADFHPAVDPIFQGIGSELGPPVDMASLPPEANDASSAVGPAPGLKHPLEWINPTA